MPEIILGNKEASAYYGVIKKACEEYHTKDIERLSKDAATAIDKIIKKHRKVDFWTEQRAQSGATNDIDDFLCEKMRGSIDKEPANLIIGYIIPKVIAIACNLREKQYQLQKRAAIKMNMKNPRIKQSVDI